jgi:hypothetical protein
VSKVVKNWRWKLQRRKNETWASKIAILERDPNLQIKVASICWWDFSGHDQKRLGTDSLRSLYVIMKRYTRDIEFKSYTYNNLVKGLMIMGYPRLEALKRAKQPKTKRDK